VIPRAVYLSPAIYHTATVLEITRVGVDEAHARVAWDDGDKENTTLILSAPTQAVHWRRAQHEATPLLLRLGMRLGNSGKVTVKAEDAYSKFMKGDEIKITPPSARATPKGIFNLVLSTAALKNAKLAEGLASGNVLLSTCLSEGADDDGSDRTQPRALDFYATTSASGSVKDLYLCVGVACPFDPLTSKCEPKKGFALGLQVAIVAPSRSEESPRKIEVRACGKAVTETQEPPIVAHPITESNLLLRRSSAVTDVSRCLGASCTTVIRKMFLKSEIFSVLTELELLAGGATFSFLAGMSTRVPRGPCAGELTRGICLAGTRSLAGELERKCKDQEGFYTEARMQSALKAHEDGCKRILQLIMNVTVENEVTIDGAQLLVELLAKVPQLKVSSGRLYVAQLELGSSPACSQMSHYAYE
jgi:hypothetical protein